MYAAMLPQHTCALFMPYYIWCSSGGSWLGTPGLLCLHVYCSLKGLVLHGREGDEIQPGDPGELWHKDLLQSSSARLIREETSP